MGVQNTILDENVNPLDYRLGQYYIYYICGLLRIPRGPFSVLDLFNSHFLVFKPKKKIR
jgi:hypothetical protein